MRGRPGTRSVNQRLTGLQRALADAIAGTESPDYNTAYGGKKFTDMSDHPQFAPGGFSFSRVQSGPNKGKLSTASGRYQMLGSTWRDQKAKLGLTDFSPENQDLAAYNLAKENYPGDLDADLASNDPAKLTAIGQALNKTWTSLPGGIEQAAAYAKDPAAFARSLQESARYYAAADQAALPEAAAHIPGLSPDNADRLAQREADINSRVDAQPDSAASRMWSGVAGVLGVTADAAKSLVQQTGVPSLVNAAVQQAATVAQASAQAQNPATPAPAAPTPATSLAHPQSIGAPVGAVQQGPDLSSPIGRINAAAQAAGVQPSRPVSATPDTARPSPDVGAMGVAASMPGATDLSQADVGGNLVSATGNIAPQVGASPMQAMQENTINQQVADASVGPAPGTVGVGKPGELGTPMAAPAPAAPAYSTPMDTPPTPKQIAAPVVAPRPVQQPMVQAPRPQLPRLPQVQQQPAAAAIASTPVNGLTSLANKPEQPMSKPQTESQIAHSLASQPGLMGALGMTSQSVNSPSSSGGAPSGGGLLSSVGGFLGGLLGNVGGLNSGNPMGIQSVNGSKTKSTLGGGDAHTAL